MSKRCAWLWLVLMVASCCHTTAAPVVPPIAASAQPSHVPPAVSAPVAEPDKEDVPPEAATGFRSIAAVRAEKHMVAAANPHASQAGIEMLRSGGSAIDAAVAMALVLTLVEPQSSGIGGGALVLAYDAQTKKIAAYDGRETAPAKATADMFLAAGQPRPFMDAVVGGLSVGVPGELRALEMAHKAHGKLPWKQLFDPAIRLCTDGFAISARLHMLLGKDPVLSGGRISGPYFFADGKPKPVGTVLKNPELAEVLRAVAAGGADAFYSGALARDIVDAVRKAPRNPGRLALSDMAAYKAVAREPVCLEYRKHEVCGFPPPTSGGITTLQVLGLMRGFDVKSMPHDSTAFAHLFAEAGRLAFADRDLYIADADFVAVPMAELLDGSYLERRSKLIDKDRAMKKAAPGVPVEGAARHAPGPSGELPSTSHMVAVDSAGNVVSMTASIETAFGSHVMVRGFLLNNQLTDFSFVPEVNGVPVANRIQPGKRPRSSMAPVIVLNADDRFVLAVGSPGGSPIISYVARVIVGVLDHGLDPQAAISRPNIVNRNGATELEQNDDEHWSAWVERTKVALEAQGHQVEVHDLTSGLQAIMRDKKGYVGGADPRREGLVLGD